MQKCTFSKQLRTIYVNCFNRLRFIAAASTKLQKCTFSKQLRTIYVNCFNRLRFIAEASTKLQKCTFSDNLRTIYVNYFNRLRFLAEVSAKFQKCTFLDNLRTQEGNMETRQITPIFSSTFSDLTVCNIHFWIWEYSKLIFIWSPLRSLLVCKIPQFLTKSYRFRQLITLS